MSESNGRYKSKWTAQGYRYANRTSAKEMKAEVVQSIVQQLRPLVEATEEESRKCFYGIIGDEPLESAKAANDRIIHLLSAMNVLLDRAQEDAERSVAAASSETPIQMAL